MTNQDEDIINTIKHYRKLIQNSKDHEDREMYICILSGIVDGLGLVLEKRIVTQLYNFAIKLDETT